MSARTALRRIAARCIADPDFDLEGIPDIDNLLEELKEEFPECFAAEQLSEEIVLWTKPLTLAQRDQYRADPRRSKDPTGFALSMLRRHAVSPDR